jgi:pimeloyl-ACP methyl ester carboxylesterase
VTVLFHHGYTSAGTIWEYMLPHFEPTYHCVTIDCRGCGESEDGCSPCSPPSTATAPTFTTTIATTRIDTSPRTAASSGASSSLSIERMATDVVQLLDHLRLQKVVYVGHSMGGLIGMHLGLEHESRVRSLVLVTPASSRGLKAPASMLRSQVAARHAIRAGDKAAAAEAMRRLALTQPSGEVSARLRAQFTAWMRCSDAHLEGAWHAMERYACFGRLNRLRVPTLVVAGAADSLLGHNLRDLRRMPRLSASVHVFSGEGHNLPVDVSAPLAECVLRFLRTGVITFHTLAARL